MPDQPIKRELILASTSPYRKQLLERLQIPFSVQAPDVDESPFPNEKPEDLVLRLAREKAQDISTRHEDSVVIGSDQVAVFGGLVLGKPGTVSRATRQLKRFSGQTVHFLTAICVSCCDSNFTRTTIVTSEVRFRILNDDEIKRYLEVDNPLDCAGGFKSEAAGSAILKYLRSDDPTAIIGLPLITVAELLRENGYNVP